MVHLLVHNHTEKYGFCKQDPFFFKVSLTDWQGIAMKEADHSTEFLSFFLFTLSVYLLSVYPHPVCPFPPCTLSICFIFLLITRLSLPFLVMSSSLRLVAVLNVLAVSFPEHRRQFVPMSFCTKGQRRWREVSLRREIWWTAGVFECPSYQMPTCSFGFSLPSFFYAFCFQIDISVTAAPSGLCWGLMNSARMRYWVHCLCEDHVSAQ